MLTGASCMTELQKLASGTPAQDNKTLLGSKNATMCTFLSSAFIISSVLMKPLSLGAFARFQRVLRTLSSSWSTVYSATASLASSKIPTLKFHKPDLLGRSPARVRDPSPDNSKGSTGLGETGESDSLRKGRTGLGETGESDSLRKGRTGLGETGESDSLRKGRTGLGETGESDSLRKGRTGLGETGESRRIFQAQSCGEPLSPRSIRTAYLQPTATSMCTRDRPVQQTCDSTPGGSTRPACRDDQSHAPPAVCTRRV